MTEVIVSDDLLNFEIKTKKIPQNDEEAKILLDKVWGRYFDLSAFQLSKMTHCDDDDNPWKVAIESAEKEYIVRGKEINSEDIRKYFKKLLKAKRAY